MKILVLPYAIYEPKDNLFIEDTSGHSLMVCTIVNAMAQINEVYIITPNRCTEHNYSSIHYCAHTLADIFWSMRPKNMVCGIGTFFRCALPFRIRMAYAYYAVDMGYLRRQIMTLKPDVVHIHAATLRSAEILDICHQLGVPAVVTLHGLNGISDSIGVNQYMVDAERRLLKKAQALDTPVSLISTGVMNRAIIHYQLSGKNMRVILNAKEDVDLKDAITHVAEVKSTWKIDGGKRVIIAVGSVSQRKNQVEIIEAFALLPEELRNGLVLMIVGQERDHGETCAKVAERGLEDSVRMCGFVDREALCGYYCAASLNVLASIDEGFGLSLVEACQYGVPSVMYGDIDAASDLYSPDAMIKVERRGPQELSSAIAQALERNWNREAIIAHSRKFNISAMVQLYQHFYQDAIKKKLRKS